MKISYATLLVAFTLLLSSCNFSVGTQKDLLTGLSYSYNGFAVEQVVLVGPDNVPMGSNEVEMDSEVAIVIQGLENYALKDNKAFPGLMLVLTDKAGSPVVEEADLFAGGEGYPATDASALRGSVTVGDPMESGETYHLKMHVWDKIKPENVLTAEVDIVVK